MPAAEALHFAQNVPPTEEKILSMYFVEKIKPKVISRKLKVTREKVYKIIEAVKSAFVRYQERKGLIKMKFHKIDPEVWKEVDDYCERHRHQLFTIADIQSRLESTFGRTGVASDSSIRNHLKSALRLSFKRVSERPKVTTTSIVLNKRLNYIKFYRLATAAGYKVIQVDEFSVGRSTVPNMAWIERGASGWVVQERPSKSHSVIVAISNHNLELLTISNNTTNGEVFLKFMRLLASELQRKYKNKSDKLIITWDGARYHSVKEVRKYWNDAGIMMVQTAPYSPEFSPVELFINEVKNSVRKFIRKGK